MCPLCSCSGTTTQFGGGGAFAPFVPVVVLQHSMEEEEHVFPVVVLQHSIEEEEHVFPVVVLQHGMEEEEHVSPMFL